MNDIIGPLYYVFVTDSDPSWQSKKKKKKRKRKRNRNRKYFL